jgi:uncharacterized protein
MDTRRTLLRQIAVFLVMTSALTTLLFIWMFRGARNDAGAVFLMMWTPGIAAVLTSLSTRDRIRDYGWKPGRWSVIGCAYVLPLVVSVIGYGLVWLTPFAEFSSREPTHYKWAAMLGFALPVPFAIGVLSKMVLGFAVALPFALGEEIGWSGFLIPKLLRVCSTPKAALVAGSYWAIWHFPAIIGGFYGSGAPLWVALPGFTMTCIAHSLVKAVLLSRSQSVWVGAVLHASANIIYMGLFWEMTAHKGYAAYLLSETGAISSLAFAGVALLVWRVSASTASRDTAP